MEHTYLPNLGKHPILCEEYPWVLVTQRRLVYQSSISFPASEISLLVSSSCFLCTRGIMPSLKVSCCGHSRSQKCRPSNLHPSLAHRHLLSCWEAPSPGPSPAASSPGLGFPGSLPTRCLLSQSLFLGSHQMVSPISHSPQDFTLTPWAPNKPLHFRNK